MSEVAIKRTVVAERLLKSRDCGREVAIKVYLPEIDVSDPNGDWMCEWDIDGVPGGSRQRSYGVDSMQALIQAFCGIDNLLRNADDRYSWLENKQGYTGIPLIIQSEDSDFVELIRNLVEVEHIRRHRIFEELYELRRKINAIEKDK
jgi:hypothetical protein